VGEMNGIYYWEYESRAGQDAALDGEAGVGPAVAGFTTKKRKKGESAERSGWKGPGTLWLAEPEKPPRDR